MNIEDRFNELDDHFNGRIDELALAITDLEKKVEQSNLRTHVADFPKLKSPFVRGSNEACHWVVTPQIEEGYEWVFNDAGVRAVDKLDGTNTCVLVKDGELLAVDNRTTRVFNGGPINSSLGKGGSRFIMGVLRAIERGYLGKTGRFYGELIGPGINGNRHQETDFLFVPFDRLLENCHWHSWIGNKYPKTYNSISDWFRELPSLFSQKHGKEIMAEGLVFHHPDGRMAKLRRDMFDWYHEGKK